MRNVQVQRLCRIRQPMHNMLPGEGWTLPELAAENIIKLNASILRTLFLSPFARG